MVKKWRPPPPEGRIRKTDIRGELLTFSFRHFANDETLCPREHPAGYAQKLAERLRNLSRWTVAQFTERVVKSVRNHRITWPETSRPEG